MTSTIPTAPHASAPDAELHEFLFKALGTWISCFRRATESAVRMRQTLAAAAVPDPESRAAVAVGLDLLAHALGTWASRVQGSAEPAIDQLLATHRELLQLTHAGGRTRAAEHRRRELERAIARSLDGVVDGLRRADRLAVATETLAETFSGALVSGALDGVRAQLEQVARLLRELSDTTAA